MTDAPALARDIIAKVRAGQLDPRRAAEALGLRFDQDAIMAILESAAEGVAADGWRPIETAPRDGTEVEIAQITRARWSDPGSGIDDMWQTDEAFVEDSEFTHWRPLPGAPKPHDGGETT